MGPLTCHNVDVSTVNNGLAARLLTSHTQHQDPQRDHLQSGTPLVDLTVRLVDCLRAGDNARSTHASHYRKRHNHVHTIASTLLIASTTLLLILLWLLLELLRLLLILLRLLLPAHLRLLIAGGCRSCCNTSTSSETRGTYHRKAQATYLQMPHSADQTRHRAAAASTCCP